MFSNEKVANSSNVLFYCECCDYTTSKKFNFEKHLETSKHNKSIIINNSVENVVKSSNPSYTCCYCEKTYKDNSGLWRHKKKCKEIQSGTSLDQTKLIEYLMKENSEFKQLMIEQNKQMFELAKNSGHNNNSNNTNSNNKTFNLQVFLNETCKNAINMSEFIDQLQVSITDLEETGRLGFTEGISKIFINGLKQMNIPDRPLHCSDMKRETIYIKNNNEWTKDSDENLLLVDAIKRVSNKNIKQISEWQKVNPEYKNSSSKMNDKYLKIVSESMSGTTKEECDKNYKKIVKNIAKETVIDKTPVI
jgi:hypothetical protein